jgi:hypothetical protein
MSEIYGRLQIYTGTIRYRHKNSVRWRTDSIRYRHQQKHFDTPPPPPPTLTLSPSLTIGQPICPWREGRGRPPDPNPPPLAPITE